jgi:hypothetical protein
MQAIQWRHIKLSYAGKLGSWGLAGYELSQKLESLSNAARLYAGIGPCALPSRDPVLMHNHRRSRIAL